MSQKIHINYSILKIKSIKALGYYIKGSHLNKDSPCWDHITDMHVYLNYGNIAWGCSDKRNLTKLMTKRKHALHIAISEGPFEQ